MAIIRRYVYRGEEGERIPDEATHITVGDGVTFVRADAFYEHENIVEVICHDKVKKIKEYAFAHCPNLRRVVMPGVKVVEREAFSYCEALMSVECGKLEVIKEWAFDGCFSLSSIDLPSVRIVEEQAFNQCHGLTNVKFSSKLQRVDTMAFYDCPSLKRITIPLKDNLITSDDVFSWCKKLKHVDLVEGELHETIAALHLEEWRNDMNATVRSINHFIPYVHAGGGYYGEGEKARAIQTWIRSVLQKIIRYQEEHESLLLEDGDAATTLQLALPRDIVVKNVLPFLALPPHTFDIGEDGSDSGGEEEDDDVSDW